MTITWTELASQPDAWAGLLDRLARPGEAPPLDLGGFEEVVVVGSGSSLYLARAVADWARRRQDVAIRAVPSCEVMLDPWEARARPGLLAIGLSRSGESSEALLALRALRRAGARVAAVTCAEGSSILGLADVPVLVPEGHEEGLVMLRSFTAMLIALQWAWGSEADRTALRRLPEAGRAVLARAADVRELANARDFDRFVFLASAESLPLAQEAGLKVQEMSISTSEAYPSLDYRHGPKSTADDRTLVSMIALPDEGHGLRLARDVKALGAALAVTGPGAGAYAGVADLVVPAPDGLGAGPASAVSLLPLQMLAHDTAIRLGRDPNAPVNLTKVVIL